MNLKQKIEKALGAFSLVIIIGIIVYMLFG